MSKMMRLKAQRGNDLKDVVSSNVTTFAMVEKVALQSLDALMKEDMQAARLVIALVRFLETGSNGVIVISVSTMCEILDVSKSTVMRAMRTLIKGNWIQRMRVGGAHAIAINNHVAWVGPRGDMEHAVFSATVVASRSEQDEDALNVKKLRPLPIINANESLLPVGNSQPPSQEIIEGAEPVITRKPTSNEPSLDELERLGQGRLVD